MRYNNRNVRKASPLFRAAHVQRGRNIIGHYGTPRLVYVSPDARAQLDHITHTWVLGDRFYKLAEKHYGDATLWWVIAQYNAMPTESHVKNAALLYIPFPIGKVLAYMGH